MIKTEGFCTGEMAGLLKYGEDYVRYIHEYDADGNTVKEEYYDENGKSL